MRYALIGLLGGSSGGGGGGTVPAGTGFTHITSGSQDASARAVNVSGADITGILAATSFPALTGDVTTSSGAVATTIAAGAVSLTKMANLAANSFIGNNTGSPATPLALTVAQAKSLLAISTSDVSGLGTAATQATSTFAQVANNGSDFANAATVRSNIGVAYGTTAGTTTQGNDSRVTSGRRGARLAEFYRFT